MNNLTKQQLLEKVEQQHRIIMELQAENERLKAESVKLAKEVAALRVVSISPAIEILNKLDLLYGHSHSIEVCSDKSVGLRINGDYAVNYTALNLWELIPRIESLLSANAEKPILL